MRVLQSKLPSCGELSGSLRVPGKEQIKEEEEEEEVGQVGRGSGNALYIALGLLSL